MSTVVAREGDTLTVSWTTAAPPAATGSTRYELRVTSGDSRLVLRVVLTEGRTTEHTLHEAGSDETVNLLGQASVAGAVVTADFPAERVPSDSAFRASAGTDAGAADTCPAADSAPVPVDQ